MKRTILAVIVFLAPAIAQQTDQCQCACVDGKVEAVCSSTIAIKPVCAPRVCDIVPPSIKPIDTPTIPPIGTDKCDLKQVLNEQTREYEWRRLCYKEDPNQTAIQPSSESGSQPSAPSTKTTNNGTANGSGALGQAVGSAIGTAIAGSIQNHRINSFCKANPTSTYVTDTGLRIDCPSASLSRFEHNEVDDYCADNPGSWIAFGKHRVDCLMPPNPPNLKWAKWELNAWQWDYKNPKKISISLTQDQMRSNWSYWQQEYCSLSGSGTKFKDLEGKKQRCP